MLNFFSLEVIVIEFVELELIELLRREVGDDFFFFWGELYLMFIMGGAGFFGEGLNRLLKLMKWRCVI